MGIFDRDRIGDNVHCLLEKNGVQVYGDVKWTQAFIGHVAEAKIMGRSRSKGWTIVELDVGVSKND